jgi:hypothetical protein
MIPFSPIPDWDPDHSRIHRPKQEQQPVPVACGLDRAGCLLWVRGGKTLREYMFSELPLTADIVATAAKHVSTR